MSSPNIDISVYIMTYYHEQYIKQAIESVLMQKTKYKYEIVIVDDCSKDKTQSIVLEYQKLYPDIIRVKINENNIGIPKNVFQARCMCKGRYIVGLSGDDYWIDPLKLEKECNFLETHKEYIAVFNGIELRLDDDDFPYDVVPKKEERNYEFSIKDYQAGKVLRSHGFMMRNFFLEEEGRKYFGMAQKISDKVDDAVDVVLIMRKGRVFIIDEVTDAHRVTRSEIGKKHNYNSRYSKIEKTAQYIDLVNKMDSYFNKDSFEVNFRKKYEGQIAVAILDMIVSGRIREYKKIFKTVPPRYSKPFIASVFITAIPHCFSFVFKRGINRVKAIFAHKKTS